MSSGVKTYRVRGQFDPGLDLMTTQEVVLAQDYAALEAECERLRVKLMVIASAEPARHGIEWAKAHAAEGNNEVYAKWCEAIDEAHALRAELEQSRDLIVEMSTHCNATALVADWLERNQ